MRELHGLSELEAFVKSKDHGSGPDATPCAVLFHSDFNEDCKRARETAVTVEGDGVQIAGVAESDERAGACIASENVRHFPTFRIYRNGRAVAESRGSDLDMLRSALASARPQLAESAPAAAEAAATSEEPRLETSMDSLGEEEPEKEDEKVDNVVDGEDEAEEEEDAAENGDELVPAVVDESVVSELEGMGMSRARSVRAAWFGKTDEGETTLESAIAWLEAHEKDADLDEPLLVRRGDIGDAEDMRAAMAEGNRELPLEERKRLARELIAQRRVEKAERAKVLLRERELRRREQGRKLQAAQDELQAAQRRRDAEQRRREKHEAAEALRKQRMELIKDKLERAVEKGQTEKANELRAELKDMEEGNDPKRGIDRISDVRERIYKAIRAMSVVRRENAGPNAIKALRTIVLNAKEKSATDPKFLRLSLNAPGVQKRLKPVLGAIEFLQGIGFETHDEDTPEPYLEIADPATDEWTRNALQHAITGIDAFLNEQDVAKALGLT